MTERSRTVDALFWSDHQTFIRGWATYYDSPERVELGISTIEHPHLAKEKSFKFKDILVPYICEVDK